MDKRRAVLLMAVLLFGTAGLAQEAEHGTIRQTEPATLSTTVPDNNAAPKRILGVVPAFDVASIEKVTQLTPGQKFALFAEETYDPFEWVTSAAEAGLEQAADEPEGFGQGSKGYFKRFGSGMADESTGEFFGSFLLPTVLHQDPRYFRNGTGNFGHRVGYSATRVFITRSDSGARQFNWSKVLGTMISGALSNIYYPRQQRGVGLTFERTALRLGTASAFNVGKEFWPDIYKRLFHRNQQDRVNAHE